MYNIKIIAALSALGLGLVCAPAARAGFINEAPPPAAPSPLATADGSADIAVKPLAEPAPVPAPVRKITQMGFRPSDIEVPRGKGHDIALADMLPVIVPHAFRIEFNDVDRDQTGAWSGGLPWDIVLANAIAPLTSVAVTIDWDHHLVSLHRMPGVATRATSHKTDAPDPQASADTAVSFDLVGGQSLETQLSGWAKRAGWAITWNTPDDWVVPHDYAYGNDFQSAVEKVFMQMAEDGADVRADIWKGNHSVVVDKAGVMQ